MSKKTFRYTWHGKKYEWTDETVISRDHVWQGDKYVAASCFWNIDVNKQKAIVYGLGMRILEGIKDFPRDFDWIKKGIFASIQESGFLSGGIKSTRRNWETFDKFWSHTRFDRALSRLRVDLYALADKEKAASAVSNENRYIPPSTPDVPDTDPAQKDEEEDEGLGTAQKLLIVGGAAAILMLIFKRKK